MSSEEELFPNFNVRTLSVALTTPCVSPTKKCPRPLSLVCQGAQVSIGACDGNVSIILWLRPGEEIKLNKFAEELDALIRAYLTQDSASAR